MAGLRFTDLQSRPTEFLDLTSVTLEEFQQLVPPFEAALQARMAAWRMDGKPRTARRFTVYKNCPLPTPEDRLFFILTYLKTYALQVVQGRLFGMVPGKAHQWMHVLLPALLAALRTLGAAPARSLTALAQRLGVSEADAATVIAPLEEESAPVVAVPAAAQGDKHVPQLAYGIDHTVLNNLSDTYLGKNIMVTDREHGSNDKIILAYRSQFNIEHVFKEMQDRDIGSWWPLYHWTDQKINVHGFYCTIALLLRALAYRRVKEAGIAISMKRLIAELDDIKEVILLYPRKRGTKTARHHTVLSKTSELQQLLLSILQVNTEDTALLG